VNVDCRWWGTSVVRVRILAAGLALVAAGCLVLGSSSRSQQHVADAATRVPTIVNPLSSPASVAGTSVESKWKTESQARALVAGLPLMFEPNQGQANLDATDPRVKFVARGSGYSLALGSEGAILTLAHRESKTPSRQNPATHVESLGMKLLGANPNAKVAAADELPGKSNYLLGNDPAKWRRDVPQFARVRYEDVYPGINLVFYGNQGQLEYDFQVAPHADAAQAELEFDGAKKLELKDGALIISAKNGSVRLEAPQVYQQIAGRREPVEGKFVLRGAHRAGFAIGNYDHSRELVIDPLLTFATYFGGSGEELNNYVAVDQSFNIYLAGSTTSANLPVLAALSTNVDQPTIAGTENVYIAKILPPAGSNVAQLQYVTYLGGSGMDYPVGVGADNTGDVYVAGTTTSSNFPVSQTNPFQSSPASTGTHVFVSRLTTPTPSLKQSIVYSSYLSGSGIDTASGMTIDGQGDIFVTGTTTSTNTNDYANGVEWPVISLPYGQPFQATPKAAAGVAQFFVTKVNTNSAGPSSIAYSTYFGGGVYETTDPVATGGGIAVDTSGVIYFTGTTNFIFTGASSSSDFPILNAYQPCLDQPPTTVIINPQTCSNTGSTSDSDAFVAKLNPNAAAGTGQLGWSTYIGGTGTDSGAQVAVDTGGQNVYVVGTTNSTDIAQSLNTISSAVAFQRCLNVPPPNPNIGTPCNPQTGTPVPTDAFLARFPNLTTSTTNTQVLQLGYFSYLGGGSDDEGLALTVDLAGGALLTGWTQSGDFPVTGGANVQGTYAGDTDAFIARLNASATAQNTAGSWTTYYGGSGFDEGTSIALDPNENAYIAGDTTSTDLQVKLPLSAAQGGTYNGGSDAFVAQVGNVGSLTVSGSLSSATNQNLVSAGSQATFVYTITNFGPDPVYNVTLSDDLSKAGITVTFQSATANAGTCTGGSTTTLVSCTIPSIQAGGLALVTIVIIPTSVDSTNPVQFNGGTITVTSPNNITPASTSVAASMTDYGLSISPPSNSVTAGNTASYQVRLSPQPIYTNSISLSCSGVPAAASCNFTSTSVTLAGSSPGTSTLNITTTARPVFTPGVALQRPRQFYAVWLFVPGIALLGFGSSNRRRRRISGLMLLSSVCLLLVFLPACSHSAVQPPVSGTPAGTYTINVTSTSGSDTKTQSIQLNVN
jgi:uncharacterized repeat protein (TIGR01451 family)